MKHFLGVFIALIIVIGLTACSNSPEETHSNATVSTTPISVADSEVLEHLSDKYNMKFKLWGAQDDSLFVYYIYPNYADWECHILMPENTDDITQYQKGLSWEVSGDELIISGVDTHEIFKIDITQETATSTSTGRVYKIYDME